MTQYKTQYGTIFAVKEHGGAPAIMCRAEHSETWSLSSMITPFTPGAWTAEELQAQLDNWAATKGWQPLEEPVSTEPPLPMPGDVYRSAKSGQFYKIDKFAAGKATCYRTMRKTPDSNVWEPANGSLYPDLTDAQGEFESWIRTEQLEPPAPAAQPSKEPPAELAPTALTNLPAFDYSGLDAETAEHLQNLARRAAQAKQRYILDMMEIVVEAHRELCNAVVARCDNGKFSKKDDTFRAWCASIGVGKDTAYRLLQVQTLMDGSSPEEQEVLADAPAKLLYAAAKPSAPAELVQAVKDGDITTHKQYQDLLARYNAEHTAREQAEQQRDEAVTHIQAARDLQIDTARERDNALQRATAAENRAAGAHKLAEQRGDENVSLKAKIRELESRPVEVAVAQPGEEQIEAWRKEGADRAAAALQDSVLKAHKEMVAAQNQLADLQDQLAAARPDADACQRTADTLYETTENLRLLLRTQLRQAQLTPKDYGNVVAHVLQAADALRDTVRSCAPAGYDIDSEEDDDFE